MTIKSLFQLCVEKHCLRVFRDKDFPEALRRKIAVLTIERILIENALKRRNTYLPVPFGLGHLAKVKHGVFIIPKSAKYPGKVCFYWFGCKHGLDIQNIRSRNVPLLVWYKMDQKHGLSVSPSALAGKFKVEKYHRGNRKTLAEDKAIDIPSVIKNGCSSRFTQLAGAETHKISLELGYYWSV